MRPDIALDTDELRAHASLVDRCASEIRQAQSVAGQVAMQDDAYGVLCGPRLVPLLNLLEADAVSSIRTAAASVESLAELLRVMADDTDHTDRVAAGRMGGGD
jgi:hypothetical protein